MLALRNSRPDVFHPDIFDELMSLPNMLERAFGKNRGGWFDSVLTNHAMPLDIIETASDYRVKIDLPGVSEDNIEVRIDGDVLSVVARATTDNDYSDGNTIVAERKTYEQYSRKWKLPRNVDATGDVVANHVDGVLTLIVPKSETSTSRLIPIKKNGLLNG